MSSFLLIVLISLLGSVVTKNISPRLSLPKTEHTTSAQRISSHGYPSESYKFETSDGYVLNIFRVPYSPKLQNQNDERPVIFLQHGLAGCSDSYLLNGPDNALAYNLADAGYDVWLGNARGTLYSRNNTKISVNHPYFWRFSWHEIGVIDMAETIDYILKETGHTKLHYVGHSQGTTVFFVLMSTRPEYNEKIKTAHMLAPVAFKGNSTDSLTTQAAGVLGVPGLYGDLFGDQELLPSNPFIQNLLDQAPRPRSRPRLNEQDQDQDQDSISKPRPRPRFNVQEQEQDQDCYVLGLGLGLLITSGNPTFPKYCRNLFLLFNGEDSPNMNKTLLPQLAETHPAGLSTNQVRHYWQLYLANEFVQFDEGIKGNRKRYGQDMPPSYEVEKITSQVYLYGADADDAANPKDVSRLAALLPNLKEYHRVPNPTFDHLDFIFAMDVKAEINDRVVRACNEFENVEKLWKLK